MKVHLLYRDRDFDLAAPLPWNAEALTADLGLAILFDAMAQEDKFLRQVAEKVMLAGFEKEIATIRYRQEILRDCLEQPAAVRELYELAVEAMALAKKQYLGVLDRYPDWVLRQSVDHMEQFLELIKKLRRFTDAHAGDFRAEGWTTLLSTLESELTDAYLDGIAYHLGQLKFRNGVLLSAGLGRGNRGEGYRLHPPPASLKEAWLSRVRGWLEPMFDSQAPVYSFSLHPRDEAGAKALSELRNRGLSLAARALAQSREHVRNFFNALRTELAFYIGCLNLRDRLADLGEPIGFATPAVSEERRLSFQGLYDVSLALSMGESVVANDGDGDGKDLVLVTGANQGGKSTFLRSVGLAQLMMQCGLFVPAESFAASVCDHLFTHYKREEDTALESGKLDEELGRMSLIVDHLKPHALVLLNESFAATNEREGSEIARQILSAMVEEKVRVVCVTHLYELARGFHETNARNVLFLRAERHEDGTRTFKLIEGEPLPTSFGEDLFRNVFGEGNSGWNKTRRSAAMRQADSALREVSSHEIE